MHQGCKDHTVGCGGTGKGAKDSARGRGDPRRGSKEGIFTLGSERSRTLAGGKGRTVDGVGGSNVSHSTLCWKGAT